MVHNDLLFLTFLFVVSMPFTNGVVTEPVNVDVGLVIGFDRPIIVWLTDAALQTGFRVEELF